MYHEVKGDLWTGNFNVSVFFPHRSHSVYEFVCTIARYDDDEATSPKVIALLHHLRSPCKK